MRYIITRQNSDGTFSEAGGTNRTIVDGYKTYKNAFKYAINPFGRGALVRVECYPGSLYTQPSDTFTAITTA